MQQKHLKAVQGAFGILSWVAAMTIKTLPDWAFWFLIALSVALMGYAFYGFIFHRGENQGKLIWLPVRKLHPNKDCLFPYAQALTIKAAAQIAYDKTHNTGLADNATRWAKGKPAGDALDTFAYYFKELDGYTLYGRRPSSNVYQVIPSSESKSLWFTDDLTGLKHIGGQGETQYVDIAVTKTDLRKLIKEAKKIDRDTVQANANAVKKSPLNCPGIAGGIFL